MKFFISHVGRTRLVFDLEKSHGPFVGPRGGRWSDPSHTSTWKPRWDGDEPTVNRQKLLDGNLGIPRIEMPQIPQARLPEFLTQLQTEGVEVTAERVPVFSLKATQNELHTDRIKDDVMHADLAHLAKPVVVSSDDYLLDGHHRWAALGVMDDENDINVVRVDLPIFALLEQAHAFDGTHYQKSEEAELRKARWMSWLGNEDAPLRSPQSVASGTADEMEMTVRGKRKRKPRKTDTYPAKLARRDLTALGPRGDGRPEPAPVNTDNVGDLKDASHDGRQQKIQTFHVILDHKKANPPPVDHMRAMRMKDGS